MAGPGRSTDRWKAHGKLNTVAAAAADLTASKRQLLHMQLNVLVLACMLL